MAFDGNIAGAGPMRGAGAMAPAGGTTPASGTTPEGKTTGAGISLLYSGSIAAGGSPKYNCRRSAPCRGKYKIVACMGIEMVERKESKTSLKIRVLIFPYPYRRKFDNGSFHSSKISSTILVAYTKSLRRSI